MGVSSSLALNEGDRAWIAYLDDGRANVKLAHTIERIYLPVISFFGFWE